LVRSDVANLFSGSDVATVVKKSSPRIVTDMETWSTKLGRLGVARTIVDVVIAGRKARSAVFMLDDLAIHAGRRLAETRRHRLIRGSSAWTTASSPVVTRKIREGQSYCAMVSETVGRPGASCASRPNRY
jgi:hypothetical protein